VSACVLSAVGARVVLAVHARLVAHPFSADHALTQTCGFRPLSHNSRAGTRRTEPALPWQLGMSLFVAAIHCTSRSVASGLYSSGRAQWGSRMVNRLGATNQLGEVLGACSRQRGNVGVALVESQIGAPNVERSWLQPFPAG